ncbi:MAG: aromatic ring-hydroxylating oxygenase subunit alpha [Myxococcota bacterium]
MDELRAATLAPGPGVALPFFAYTDPSVHELEMERVFRGDWVAVCAAAELQDPGDYLALTIGGEPVALVRGDDGELRALSNVYRHRGTLLLDPGRGHVSSLICPYHAWAYGYDGAFRGAPHTGNVEIRAKDHSLPSFRTETWAGVAFVNVSGDAEPLADRFAGMAPHLSNFGIERFTHSVGDVAAETWNANWKLAFENGIESYHLFKVHRDTLEKLSPTRGAYYVEGSPSWTLTAGAVHGDSRPRSGEPESIGAFERSHYLLVSLPPSFVGVLTRDSWGWITIHPEETNRCSITTGALVAEASAAAGSEAGDFTEAFLAEDRWICERGQRGMQARHSHGGSLVELERVVGDFHRYLGRQLFGAEVPE